MTVLSVLPLWFKSAFGALGEPAAEDFDMIRHALAGPSFLYGGGTTAFWRPVAFQGYFGLMKGLILEHPQVVAAIHAALLALSAWLIYRVLRDHFGGPVAAAAASFPLLAEAATGPPKWSRSTR